MTLEQEIQIREKAIAKQVAEQVREETWKEASENTQIKTAQKLLNSGKFSVSEISEYSGLSLEKVNALIAK